jgi:hypothetical protein
MVPHASCSYVICGFLFGGGRYQYILVGLTFTCCVGNVWGSWGLALWLIRPKRALSDQTFRFISTQNLTTHYD